jgi:ATP-dependent RNA helicase DDX21
MKRHYNGRYTCEKQLEKKRPQCRDSQSRQVAVLRVFRIPKKSIEMPVDYEETKKEKKRKRSEDVVEEKKKSKKTDVKKSPKNKRSKEEMDESKRSKEGTEVVEKKKRSIEGTSVVEKKKRSKEGTGVVEKKKRSKEGTEVVEKKKRSKESTDKCTGSKEEKSASKEKKRSKEGTDKSTGSKEEKSVSEKQRSKEDKEISKSSADSNISTATESAKVVDPLSLEKYRISTLTKQKLLIRGVSALFPIQAATFDLIYDGNDVVGRARTGTGKTLSFALPIVERLSARTQDGSLRGRAPRVLVMCPTRELARQVATELESIVPDNLKVLCVYGGVPYYEQEEGFRQGIDVVVGTPGRLMDHLERGRLRLNNLDFVVLDEGKRICNVSYINSTISSYIYQSLDNESFLFV